MYNNLQNHKTLISFHIVAFQGIHIVFKQAENHC
jgi:hypothetical protein